MARKPPLLPSPSPREAVGSIRVHRGSDVSRGGGNGIGKMPPTPDPSPPRASAYAQRASADKSRAGGGESPARAPQDDGDQLPSAALYRLMAWLSPSYPVGAFSFSGGLEWAVEAGDVSDAVTLTRWLTAVLRNGSGFCDAVFFIHAYEAATAGDDAGLRAVADLAGAFAPSKERHVETTAQGRAFLEATCAAWPCAALETWTKSWDGPTAYPVAVAIACAGHGVALAPSLQAFLQAVAANLVSAGVRLIPLGQTEGLRILASLEPEIIAVAEAARGIELNDVGSATFRADIATMEHETQYTRLFRS